MEIYGIIGYTPKELYLALKDYDEQNINLKKKIFEEERKDRWEMMRMQTIRLINVQLPESKQYKSVQSFMKFPWDDEEKEYAQSVEEQKALFTSLFGPGIPLKERIKRDGS